MLQSKKNMNAVKYTKIAKQAYNDFRSQLIDKNLLSKTSKNVNFEILAGPIGVCLHIVVENNNRYQYKLRELRACLVAAKFDFDNTEIEAYDHYKEGFEIYSIFEEDLTPFQKAMAEIILAE